MSAKWKRSFDTSKVKGMLWCQQSELESERDALMDAK